MNTAFGWRASIVPRGTIQAFGQDPGALDRLSQTLLDSVSKISDAAVKKVTTDWLEDNTKSAQADGTIVTAPDGTKYIWKGGKLDLVSTTPKWLWPVVIGGAGIALWIVWRALKRRSRRG